MGAISAFSATVETLKRNRALLGVALVVTTVNFGLTAVTAVLPPRMAGLASLPLTGAMYVLLPFMMGGLLAMAHEGLGGVTRFETFLDGGKANYLRLLGSMVLFAVVFGAIAVAVVLALAMVVVLVVGMNFSDPGNPLAMSGSGLVAVAVAGLVSFLALMLPMFFLQFYAPAIVVSNLGVVEAFKRSVGLVRRNLVPTLGYTAVAALVGTVAGLAGVVFSAVGGFYGGATAGGTLFPEAGVEFLAVAAVAAIVLTTLVSAFGVTYQVAFYEDRLDSLA